MERDRISPILLISLLSLFGCDVPPGCGPVTSGTGGWPVQCDGFRSREPDDVGVASKPLATTQNGPFAEPEAGNDAAVVTISAQVRHR